MLKINKLYKRLTPSRELYWTDWGEPDPQAPGTPPGPPTFNISGKYPMIGKANLDGSNMRVIVDGKDHPGILQPYGIQLDFESKYYASSSPFSNSALVNN